MQHLGRADAVDDLQAEALLPAVEGVRRQGLGGGDAQANRVERAVGGVLAHQAAVERRDRAEHRRAVLAQLGEDRLGARRARHEHRRGAEPEGEREAVAQAVGMEELGRREDDVVLAQAEHLAREGLARHLDVVMQVHDALGLAGRARAVEPEGHVVAVRGRRVELVALCHQSRVEFGDVAVGDAADEVADVDPVERLAHARQQGGVGGHDVRVGVLGVVAVVVDAIERTDGDRDGADLQGAEEERGEGRRVVEDHQHAVLAADAELAQQVPGAVGLPAQPVVGQRRVGGEVGGLLAAAGLDVAVDQEARVVALGNDGAHLRPPRA